MIIFVNHGSPGQGWEWQLGEASARVFVNKRLRPQEAHGLFTNTGAVQGNYNGQPVKAA